MREIKFRAWDDKEKKWLLGYEYPNLGGFSMFGEMMIMGEYTNLLSSYFPERLNDIKLMQYTGLKDKNGKEIYEGDIIEHCEYKFAVPNITPVSRTTYWDDNITDDWMSMSDVDWEIIGNIYENKNLLTNK